MSIQAEYSAHSDNLDLLVETLELAVPLRMVWIDRKARAWAKMTGKDGDYDKRVQQIGREVYRAHWRVDERGDHVGTLTGSLISDTNVGVVAQMGDQLMGSSTRGAGETLFTALCTIIAAGALVNPDGATFHDHHWCRGSCTRCTP